MHLLASRSFTYSLLLHIFVFGLLFVSLENTPELIQPSGSDVEVIDAVAVDNSQVEQELERFREIEQQKQAEQERQQQALQRQAEEAEQKTREAEQRRKQEELRLAELKKKQQEEVQRRQEEEQRLAETRKKQEELAKQQAELERKQKEEAERRRQEEIAKAEAERKRQEEEALKKKQAEEEQRRREEAARIAAAQDRLDQTVIGQYVGRIQVAITREFNTTGLPASLSCILQIRMIPGGEVVEARIIKSSGNAIFDSRAEIAVKRASPLPVPDDQRVFGKMREIRLTFAPN